MDRYAFYLSAVFHKVKVGLKIRYALNVFGIVSVFVCFTEGDYLLVKARSLYGFQCIFIIAVYYENIGSIIAELSKRCSQIIHRFEKVEVICVDIKYYRNIRKQVQECVGKLTRFAYHDIAFTCSAAAADSFQLAADHR